MSLIAIKQHLEQVKMASLSALAAYFHTDVECMRCMLEHWVKKGKVKKCLKTTACKSKCFKCDTAAIEIYEWCGDYAQR